MKSKLLFVLILFCTYQAKSQTNQNLLLDSITNKYIYEKIEDFPNLKKEELFKKSLEWVALNNPIDQISSSLVFKDIDAGIIKINIYSKHKKTNYDNDMFCTLILNFKDYKTKFSLSNFNFIKIAVKGTFTLESRTSDKSWHLDNNILNSTNERAIIVYNSFISYINTKQKDW